MIRRARSPDRHVFQRENYIQRCKEKNEDPNPDYLELFDKILIEEEHRFDNPEKRKNDLEWDLCTTDWIVDKVQASELYAQNLYAALCNNVFQRLDTWQILTDQHWSCSWRYAGGIVANMRESGDYIDWYCSGIRDDYSEKDPLGRAYVSESTVTDEINADLKQLGWAVIDDPDRER